MTHILPEKSRSQCRAACLMLLLLVMQLPVTAQMMAQSEVRPPRPVQVPMLSLINALDRLKEQFHTDILFEEKNLESLMVPASALRPQKTIEASLTELLTPLGLRYAKKKNNYIILSGKIHHRSKPKPRSRRRHRLR
ncbi:hypothetical protein [Dyadobacter sandarakinus]|uniref:Secretin/TonB short N-terminal domain-containing protein n=1 Tax=Dyadobacter sandarakinus TaxID=2747268 RepID=A0ABX7I2L6_9BACT|nr:hypothetical protein [Dyadobacter sandarakinus]QRR00185.1 hypothetical protein HWI92_04345 [Dyadobacter sandarakinus]